MPGSLYIDSFILTSVLDPGPSSTPSRVILTLSSTQSHGLTLVGRASRFVSAYTSRSGSLVVFVASLHTWGSSPRAPPRGLKRICSVSAVCSTAATSSGQDKHIASAGVRSANTCRTTPNANGIVVLVAIADRTGVIIHLAKIATRCLERRPSANGN